MALADPDGRVLGLNPADIERYCAWIGEKAGADVRLLTIAEREFAIRAGFTRSGARFWVDEHELHHYGGFRVMLIIPEER